MKRSNNTLFKDIRSHEVKARERVLAAARGTYTVMDIETTGMYSDITEIAALRVVSGEIRDTFHTLVKAKGPIEKRVERLTGITSDMLEGQPPIGDVLPIFMTFIEGFPLVGHGLDSDLIVIDRNLKAVNLLLPMTISIPTVLRNSFFRKGKGNTGNIPLKPLQNIMNCPAVLSIVPWTTVWQRKCFLKDFWRNGNRKINI